MNYIEKNSTLTSYFDGSRRLSNIFWSTAVSLGGLGFFLTGLSSFFETNLLLQVFLQIMTEDIVSLNITFVEV